MGWDNRRLATRYRNARSGECPLAVEAIFDNGGGWMAPRREFRDLRAETQDPARTHIDRRLKRRDGRVWEKADGTHVPGPHKRSVRQDFVRKLLEAQARVRRGGPDPMAAPVRVVGGGSS